jgi:hypothetical protein
LLFAGVCSEEHIDAATRVLTDAGIIWAWQMPSMGEGDWAGVHIGLKCAARSVLAEDINIKPPSPHQQSETLLRRVPSGLRAKSTEWLSKSQRRYLLMPDGGKPTQPQRSSAAVFGLVACVADLDRQEHMYAMGGEMIGIISGE